MHPILFSVAGHAVESEGTLYLVAAVLAGVYAIRAARRNGWDPQSVIPGVLITVAAALLGARLHGLLIGRGLSFFGGVALGLLAMLGYLRWQRLPVGRVMDALTPLAPLLYAMFRLGCFLNGDDYGPPTTRPWGMGFPEGTPPTLERVHPTQLYEILLMLPVYLWLRVRRRAALPAGALTFELFLLLGVERFLAEFWRLGERGPAGLTVSQWLALALAAIGVVGRLRTATLPEPH